MRSFWDSHLNRRNETEKVPDVVDPFTEEKKSQLREFVLQASSCLDKAVRNGSDEEKEFVRRFHKRLLGVSNLHAASYEAIVAYAIMVILFREKTLEQYSDMALKVAGVAKEKKFDFGRIILGSVSKAVGEAATRLDNFIPEAGVLRLFHKVLSDEEQKEELNGAVKVEDTVLPVERYQDLIRELYTEHNPSKL